MSTYVGTIRLYLGTVYVDLCRHNQWRGNDFSTGWSRPTFSSWGSGGTVRPQRGPGQSPGGKRILTTIFGKLTENQVSGSTAVLTEAVINLVDIHDRLVTSLVYCAISHWYYTSSSCGLSILPCLFTGNITS